MAAFASDGRGHSLDIEAFSGMASLLATLSFVLLNAVFPRLASWLPICEL